VIVDTSALAAILFDEDEAGAITRALAGASELAMSAGNWIELTTVLVRRDRPALIAAAERLRALFGIEIVSVTATQAETARTAYVRFGKGQHRARLNFGDCFAYAASADTGRALLFKGDDFVHTDVRRAI
jgi:ribonuclease VapC